MLRVDGIAEKEIMQFSSRITYLGRKGSVVVSGPLLLTEADLTWPLLGLRVSPAPPITPL